METTTILNTLFLLAIFLLVIVSGGVLYLTTLEWRDRRRQEGKNVVRKRNNQSGRSLVI